MAAQQQLINPFKPTAGAEPPRLIGRDAVIEDFEDGIEEGVGAPARLMRITGPRGSGKTALLTELGDIARQHKWEVVDVTAKEGLLDDIQYALAERKAKPNVSIEADLGVVKAHAESAPSHSESLREQLTRTCSKLTKKGAGLFVTVDEIQDANESDVRELAASVQHLIREKENIAFAFAGLTTGVLDLINGRALTFLRRAMAEDLAAIPIAEVESSMTATFEKAGLHPGQDAAHYMAQQTVGYAYLVQLVGYRVFATARHHAEASTQVSLEDAQKGVAEALDAFASAVQEPAIANIPRRAMDYIIAMAQDEGNSRTHDIADRLGLDSSQLTSTRRQLIKEQIIEAPSRGVVRFAIPHMKRFLQENAETLLARY